MHLSLLGFELRISIEVQIGVLNLQAFRNSCFHLLFCNQWPSSVGSPACISLSVQHSHLVQVALPVSCLTISDSVHPSQLQASATEWMMMLHSAG
jgi:hypothetical protein